MPRDLDYLADILAAARLATAYVESVTAESFVEDTMRHDAVIRELLIIGEAAKRLSDEFKDDRQEIPWRKMTGMRDILVHAYDHVDLDEVWQVAKNELPHVIASVEPLVGASFQD